MTTVATCLNSRIVTLEEMLPHIRPGGVYVCEDVHGVNNDFAAYAHGLAAGLNAATPKAYEGAAYGGVAVKPTPFQQSILSFHLYPFVVVIEKAEELTEEFVAPKHGTQWQPFL